MEALRKEDGDPREQKAGPGWGVPTPQRWGSRMAPLRAASPEGALGLTYSIRAGPVGAARLCCCSWGGFLAVPPPRVPHQAQPGTLPAVPCTPRNLMGTPKRFSSRPGPAAPTRPPGERSVVWMWEKSKKCFLLLPLPAWLFSTTPS